MNFKRLFDIMVAGILSALLAPILIGLGIITKIKIGTPVIFKQMRPGLHGEPFTIYKLRTMTNERDGKGNLLPDRERLTTFGKFLRNNSLDELPELYNVIKGDMSLVGPRPLLMQYIDRYTPDQARRHDVKPGITGWAQVNGRNAITWEDKFEFDVWYVDNHTLKLDIRILFMTALNVIEQKDITAKGDATMPLFLGSTDDIERKTDLNGRPI